ncbi:flagellar basal-body MS-ring/collar protein FliF [Roseitranquillus sediminis]|uniref:flagellar basal-body MS-ring/collar protein FliF n=1 Tax=Roseitranquillus sediminis TaxID=2809051 RepID=UPI001D0C953D|nr:flagellar basal-body MS-ring/collar protein FliF [Roseitranquillus sediminis]MBM9596137.1 flagellar M-ring protein FliF [Roseitranquillus sediminis]
MQQILSVWNGLDTRRRVIIIGATLAMFAAVIGLSRMASRPTMDLLYSGLESSAAGEVVAALDQRGVSYEIRGSSIFVDAGQRDQLRMTLAGEGLPSNGGQGYELLDTLSGFGTTSQMFDAAYWRAKEGELARTIVSSPQIKSARVHIATAGTGAFRRQVAPTASVTVTPADGSLSVAHAKALRYLVASAISGMDPEGVSVIDSRSGTVIGGDESDSASGADDRAAELKRNVERMLEARVGYGNAIVEVSVETVTDREQITERRFDPEGRVAISQETEERTNSSSDSRGGEVTVASNLPDGDAAAGDGRSSSSNSETRERTNFEVSETMREVLRTPGAVKKISVAVLIDGIRTVDANGESVWEARPAEEMEALRELVASAVGFDEARGDTLTLKSMEFLPPAELGTAASNSLYERLALDTMSLIQMAVLALVALALGLFVVRPILANRSAATPSKGALPAPAGAGDDGLPELPALDGEVDGDFFPPAMNLMTDFDLDGSGASASGKSEAVTRLRKLIEERQEETVGVLRSWMEDSGGRA